MQVYISICNLEFHSVLLSFMALHNYCDDAICVRTSLAYSDIMTVFKITFPSGAASCD